MKHFEELNQQRILSKKKWPIFALEHGLSSEEINLLQADIRESISKRSPSPQHMLPWIVYATEIGYRYEGYEYWQTFEEQTDGWIYYGNRYWIQDCFQRFHNKYGGARPSGKWANHFSIISWPITHAILPKDLQLSLARILHDIMPEFSREMFDDPQLLGKMIEAQSWRANSRFQELAQNSSLVGQIATALLFQGQEGFETLILSSTLNRIRGDLDDIRSAGELLYKASRYAQRVHLEGLSRGYKGFPQTPATTITHARQQLDDLAIEPRLILQPTNTGTWRVFLEIPDLSLLATRFPQIQGVLNESRCRVAGTSGRWQARGWTMHGTQCIALEKWPKSDEVLLKFERSSSQLDFLLRTDCFLTPGQQFLFKVALDGRAYQIRSLALRPGQKYILVNTSEPFTENKWVSPAIIECENSNAVFFQMPDSTTPDLEQFTHSLNLHVAKTVEVWPAGLTAAKWDGEGYAEWLSNERPCIGIKADHEVDNLRLVLDDNQSQELNIVPQNLGEPFFISLPHLCIGTHEFTVFAQYPNQKNNSESGTLKIGIRDPQVWRPGMGTRCALTVIIEPRNPTIEQLWENHFDLQIIGPLAHKVECSFELFESGSSQPIISKLLTPLELPIGVSTWHSYFDREVRRASDIADIYDKAHSCKLIINATELGSFTLQCEREFRALRWILNKDNSGYKLKLLDDTGTSSMPTVSRFEFNKPDAAIPQGDKAFQNEFSYASNGLYFATSGENTCAIIIPPENKSFSLAINLNLKAQFLSHVRSPDGVGEIIKTIAMWSNARLTGDILCAIRQQQITDALTLYLFSLMGGKKWAAIENEILTSTEQLSLEKLALGIYSKSGNDSILKQLVALRTGLGRMSTSDRISTLSRIVKPFVRIIQGQSVGGMSIANIDWLSELALRLASQPERALTWAGKNWRWGLDQLLQQPILIRAARSMVIMINEQATRDIEHIISGWDWDID